MKYYAVTKGLKTGCFTSWEECKGYVERYSGSEYKSFKTREEAEEYLNDYKIKAVVGYVKGEVLDDEPPKKKSLTFDEEMILKKIDTEEILTSDEAKKIMCETCVDRIEPFWHMYVCICKIKDKYFSLYYYINVDADFHTTHIFPPQIAIEVEEREVKSKWSVKFKL